MRHVTGCVKGEMTTESMMGKHTSICTLRKWSDRQLHEAGPATCSGALIFGATIQLDEMTCLVVMHEAVEARGHSRPVLIEDVVQNHDAAICTGTGGQLIPEAGDNQQAAITPVRLLVIR